MNNPDTTVGELVERLTRRCPCYCDQDEPTFLVNPDGPEAADKLSSLQKEIDTLRGAAQEVCDTAFRTYRARNGRPCSIEGDDGEACEIVPSDAIFNLRAALSNTGGHNG